MKSNLSSMKKSLVVLCMSAIFLVLNTRAELPPMVAYWPLDEGEGEDIKDVVGQNHGKLESDNVESVWITGKIGGAISSDGHTIRGKVPHSPDVDVGEESFSVSFWMRGKKDQSASQPRLFTKGDYFSRKSDEIGKRWEFLMTGNSKEMSFTLDDDNLKSEMNSPSTAFLTDDWVHVVGVRDRSQKKIFLYANGVVQPSKNPESEALNGTDRTGSLSNPTTHLTIGDSHYDDNGFPGDIDDIRIFKHALTKDNVAELFAISETTRLRGSKPPIVSRAETMAFFARGFENKLILENGNFQSIELFDFRGQRVRLLPATSQNYGMVTIRRVLK